MPSKIHRVPRKNPPAQSTQPFKPKGLVLVYSGDGKGKSTAAFGAAFRALGRGQRVAMVQFLKGKWKTGEVKAAQKFGSRFRVFSFGEGFTWETKNFSRDVEIAEQAWNKCLEVLRDLQYSLVIFDEINCAIQYRFLALKEVLRGLKGRRPGQHVILTGRGAPSALIKFADLATEMRCIKHPFQKGILAQPGIDY